MAINLGILIFYAVLAFIVQILGIGICLFAVGYLIYKILVYRGSKHVTIRTSTTAKPICIP